ncbi:hypothetical protein PIB30_101982 [Stylosanthes scabra]|uniref:Uncharacterized protein n=1 Tax=Stylosanthes scabra TaxID=79078 RepID=A0ABU6SYE1_9FABA|nr:hypothetical protein [Stylosanthes scabra]
MNALSAGPGSTYDYTAFSGDYIKEPHCPDFRNSATTQNQENCVRMSVKPIRCRFPQRIIARGGPSRPVTTERIIIDDSSDSEINKNVENDVKEQNAMDEPLILEEEEVLEEEQWFWDYDGLDDWGTAEPADSSKASCTKHPPPNP